MRIDTEVAEKMIDNEFRLMGEVWQKMAFELGAKHGILIRVFTHYLQDSSTKWDRIYFGIGKHHFDSYNELERAVKMRAFL
jgi:hypothetical protein